MTDDVYLIAITALLPLTAVMLVLQVNPYQALVMRGILGAIAALVYALFGAADVALTEALVGTMLSITLYAVAVRSSMEMRLGWVQDYTLETIENQAIGTETNTPSERELQPEGLNQALVNALQSALKLEHLRLEMVSYSSQEALEIALQTKRIHSMVLPSAIHPTASNPAASNPAASNPAASNGSTGKASSYKIQTRVKRLHEILQDRLPPGFAQVDYLDGLEAPSAPAAAQLNLSPSTQESL